MTVDLRLGRWQDVLRGEMPDAVITDPPYSARTHAGQHDRRAPVDYRPITPDAVDEIVDSWAPRTRGWICVLTDHVAVPWWERAMARHDRVAFAPLACVVTGSSVRLSGDGPASWTRWLVVARPRSLSRWGSLPGAYVVSAEHGHAIRGQQPLRLMRQIVADYSEPGDLICDPFAGMATTLLAASAEGRRAVGAEMDPETHRLATARLTLDDGRQAVLPGVDAVREVEP